MKFRYCYENKTNGEITKYRTLKELSDKLDIPYYKCQMIIKADDKLYLHNDLKQLVEKHKIYKNIE